MNTLAQPLTAPILQTSRPLIDATLQVRVSDTKASDYGDSWEMQEQLGRLWAPQNGFRIVKVFYEPYTGKAWNRPVMEDLLAFLRKNPNVKTHIIPRVDRFTRAGSDFYLEFKRRLDAMGVELRDVQGTIQPKVNLLAHTGFEYDWAVVSPSRGSEVAKAEAARDEVVQFHVKTINKEIYLANCGYSVRPAPLGLMNQKVLDASGKKKSITVPHPEEGQWLSAIFTWCAEGMLSDQEICDRVNAMGFRTRKKVLRHKLTREVLKMVGGKELTPKMMRKMIANPRYCNVIDEKWTRGVAIYGQGKGLVSIETFNRANQGKVAIRIDDDGKPQVVTDRSPYTANVDNPAFPYRFVVRCPQCGKGFRGSFSRGKLGKRYPGYHCSSKHPYLRIAQKEFHRTVETFCASLKLTAKSAELFEAVALEVWERNEGRAEQNREQHTITLQEWRDQQKAIAEQLVMTTSPVAKRLLEEKIDEIEKTITSAKQTQSQEEVTRPELERYLKEIKTIMEDPLKALVEPTNQRFLKRIWGIVFTEYPTYENLTSGTPNLSLAFELCRGSKVSKKRLVAQLCRKWNTFAREVKGLES